MKKLLVAICAVMAVVVTGAIGAQADTTVAVSGDTASGENQPGWLFNRDTSTSTPFTFTTDEASIGYGSLYVEPIGTTAADKLVAEQFILTPMADISGISYDFQIGSGGDITDADQFYMNVYANFGTSDPLKFYDCRYSVVPTIGSTTDFTTVSFDPTQAYPVTTRNTSPQPCPAVPADMGTDAFVRMFSVNVGDTSANDVGLDGYLDNVVVSTSSDVTTYDFEPVPSCKDGNWATFGFKNQGRCMQYLNTGKDSR